MTHPCDDRPPSTGTAPGQSVDAKDPPALREPTRRATSPVIGIAVLLGLTITLAGVSGAFVAVGEATQGPPPQAAFDASLNATDGWPDGQRLSLVHRGGDPVTVADLAVVVEVPRVDAHARLTDLPTRRLRAENVRGQDVFDNGFAGVDGALNPAHDDGTWTGGESASIRIAQGDLDVQPGDRVRIRLVHRPTNAALARLSVRATGT